MKDNAIKTALARKGAAFGTWAQMNAPEFCDIAARSGLDFVIVDMEHGSFGIEAAVGMMRAIEAGGAAAMVRVPDAGQTGIQKVLDAGAAAVLVPNVNTATTARGVVSAARYAPLGTRGACPCTRATGHGLESWPSYVEWCEHNLIVAVLIESPDGIGNYRDIIAVPGIDMIALGPFDLSQALGLKGDWKHPDVNRKQEELVNLARERGLDVMASIFDSDPISIREQVDRWRALGVRVFAVSGDRFMLSAGYIAIMSALRRGGPTLPAASDALRET